MIQLKGSQDVIKNLNRYRDTVIEGVKHEVQTSAQAIENKAIRTLSGKFLGKDGLLRIIHLDKVITNKGLSAVVGVQGNDPLPAYIEFGTGLSAVSILASYPQYVKDIAMKFYVNGRGTLRGTPYLFPAWFEERVRFQDGVRKVLNTGASKFNN